METWISFSAVMKTMMPPAMAEGASTGRMMSFIRAKKPAPATRPASSSDRSIWAKPPITGRRARARKLER